MFWEKVKIITIDNQVFIGTVDGIDDENEQYEIDLIDTKQNQVN